MVFAFPHCARRVAVLFLRANGFFCRHCNRVAYGSQSDNALGPDLAQAAESR